jgi:hypothetical protein
LGLRLGALSAGDIALDRPPLGDAGGLAGTAAQVAEPEAPVAEKAPKKASKKA